MKNSNYISCKGLDESGETGYKWDFQLNFILFNELSESGYKITERGRA